VEGTPDAVRFLLGGLGVYLHKNIFLYNIIISYNISYIKRVKNSDEQKILQKKLNFSNYLQHKKTINYYFLLDKMFLYDIIKTDIKIFFIS
jgi:hypothetical protein